MRTRHRVSENAADHISGAVGGNMYGGHLQDEEFDGNVRRKRQPGKRFMAVDDSAYRQVSDGPPVGAIAESDVIDPQIEAELDIGDMVDVDIGHEAFNGVRIVDVVDDVNSVAGDPDEFGEFSGPGYIVELRDGEELVVAVAQVVPGSKAKYYFGECHRLLRGLIHEALSAQHTVYHTAPVYEDDDALDDVDEMSAGGVVGSAPGPSAKTEIVKRCGTGHGKKGKPWCLYSHKGKVLGHHPTAASAYGQERAIKAHGG